MSTNFWLEVIIAVINGDVRWEELPVTWRTQVRLVIEGLQHRCDIEGDLLFP